VVRPIPGFELMANTWSIAITFLELTEVPKSLIVMGCGAVGVEFASVYSRFARKQTVVELLPRLVPLEDEEVSTELAKSFRRRGIKSQLDTKLEKLEKDRQRRRRYRQDFKRRRRETGSRDAFGRRRPDAFLLRASVWKARRSKSKRVLFRSTNINRRLRKGVYAIGDVVPTPLLAHLASKEASSRSSISPARIRDRSTCAWFRIAPIVIGSCFCWFDRSEGTRGRLRRETR